MWAFEQLLWLSVEIFSQTRFHSCFFGFTTNRLVSKVPFSGFIQPWKLCWLGWNRLSAFSKIYKQTIQNDFKSFLFAVSFWVCSHDWVWRDKNPLFDMHQIEGICFCQGVAISTLDNLNRSIASFKQNYQVKRHIQQNSKKWTKQLYRIRSVAKVCSEI